MNIAEIEREVLTEKSRRYLSRAYEVPFEHVVYIGEVSFPTPWRVACHHGTSPFVEVEPGDPFIDSRTLVVLSEKYRQIDNIHNQVNEMYVGQCTDCGRLYFGVVADAK